MKKKYSTPEMEEMEFDEPVVLEGQETSTETDTACDGIVVDDF